MMRSPRGLFCSVMGNLCCRKFRLQKILQNAIHKEGAPGGQGEGILTFGDKALLMEGPESFPEILKAEPCGVLEFLSGNVLKKPEAVQEIFKKKILRGYYAGFPDGSLRRFRNGLYIVPGAGLPGFSDNFSG